MLFFLLLLKRFVRGRSDELLIVTGKVGKDVTAKILHGGITFVWPVIQTYDWLTLAPRTINLNLEGALSKENIRVNLPCAFIVAVDADNMKVAQTAAVRILSLIEDDRAFTKFVEDLIFGQMRSVISTLTIEEINANRQVFQDNIVKAISVELAKVGLSLLSINIKDIKDEAHYIENLGKKAAAEAEATAVVAIAEQKKIGESGASKQDAERRSVVAENNLKAITAENTASASVASSNAELAKVQQETRAVNESKALITTSNAEKEAKVIEAENAKVIYETQTLTVKAQEELQKAKARTEATPEAEKLIIREKSIGEAEGLKIKERMEKEAEGIKALLEAKANGFQQIIQAAGGNPNAAIMLLISERLPDILEEYAKLSANRRIDKLICIDNGGSGNVNGGALPNITNQLITAMPKLKEVVEALGINIPYNNSTDAVAANIEQNAGDHDEKGEAVYTRKEDQ